MSLHVYRVLLSQGKVCEVARVFMSQGEPIDHHGSSSSMSQCHRIPVQSAWVSLWSRSSA